jgi:hypothetical protein
MVAMLGADLPYRLRVFLMGGRALSDFVAAHLRLSANSEYTAKSAITAAKAVTKTLCPISPIWPK